MLARRFLYIIAGLIVLTLAAGIGWTLFQVGKLLLPFMAATFVLPDPIPDEGPVDLYAHYDRTRALTFGALIIGLLLFWLAYTIEDASAAGAEPMTVWSVVSSLPWGFCLGYGLLIVVRRRWINIALLTVGLIYYAWTIIPVRLTG